MEISVKLPDRHLKGIKHTDYDWRSNHKQHGWPANTDNISLKKW